MARRRLRVIYRRTGDACALTSGELASAWLEACGRAGLLSADSDGGRRRIELGPPLPPGASGERELVDLWVGAGPAPAEACARLQDALPPGLQPLEAEELGERLPSLSSSLRWAEYEVELGGLPPAELRARVAAFLARPSLPWQEPRGERVRRIDLRAAVLALECAEPATGAGSHVRLRMRITLAPGRGARPASVLEALGVAADQRGEVVRTRVAAELPRVALRAWRERGRFE